MPVPSLAGEPELPYAVVRSHHCGNDSHDLETGVETEAHATTLERTFNSQGSDMFPARASARIRPPDDIDRVPQSHLGVDELSDVLRPGMVATDAIAEPAGHAALNDRLSAGMSVRRLNESPLFPQVNVVCVCPRPRLREILTMTAMSVNIHLYLDVDGIESPDEADRVGTEVNLVLKEHGIESWMVVRVLHEPPSVTARSEPHPIIVRGFAEWSKQFERDAETSIHAAAPQARIGIDWGYPDLD
jgi:hypothetical protein